MRADLFTEAAGIPFRRVTGSALYPGVLVGIDWAWARWPSFAILQTSYGAAFSHGRVEWGLRAGTEIGARATAPFGLAGEASLGVGYLHAFSGSPVYEQEAAGRYAQVRDWGRPRLSPSFHLGVGYDFSHYHALPLILLLEYGSFFEIPYSSTLFPVLPHVTFGLSGRYSFEGSPR